MTAAPAPPRPERWLRWRFSLQRPPPRGLRLHLLCQFCTDACGSSRSERQVTDGIFILVPFHGTLFDCSFVVASQIGQKGRAIQRPDSRLSGSESSRPAPRAGRPACRLPHSLPAVRNGATERREPSLVQQLQQRRYEVTTDVADYLMRRCRRSTVLPGSTGFSCPWLVGLDRRGDVLARSFEEGGAAALFDRAVTATSAIRWWSISDCE